MFVEQIIIKINPIVNFTLNPLLVAQRADHGRLWAIRWISLLG
jgi:hypothetical protein